MTRAFKTFLVWLLMAVLPLHAVAAGIGMSCMPQHQSMRHTAAAAAAPILAPAPAPQQDAGEAHAHHGHHDAGASAPAAASMADSGDPDQDGGKTHSSCSACSAFCIGAVAPPSDYAPLLPFGGSEAVVIAPAAFAAGFIPDGPQRPPRRHSA
ncbi:hypothetical protein [Massilia sp. DD77]|uniref:hypothetical protein n=1 Tax=Massilia sp. DD77 TaxID=3109349 RepID=UPI002FFDD696